MAVTRDKDSYTLVKEPKKTGDDAWKLAKPAGVTLDTTKVNAIVSAFKEWKASSFAEDNSPEATGLAKPTATMVASAKGGGCSFKVGAETGRQAELLRRRPGAPTCSSPPSGRWTASW